MPGSGQRAGSLQSYPCGRGLPLLSKGKVMIAAKPLWTLPTRASSSSQAQVTEMGHGSWGGKGPLTQGSGRGLVGFVDYKNVSSFGQLLESIFAVLRQSSNAWRPAEPGIFHPHLDSHTALWQGPSQPRWGACSALPCHPSEGLP